MALFSPVGSSKTTTSLTGATNPTVAQVAMATANTEYSFALPADTKQFMILTENGSKFLFAYTALGSSAGFPVPRNCFYAESELTVTGLTLYFQSPIAAEVMQIIVWT